MRGPRARKRQALDEGIFGTRSGHTAVKLFRVYIRFIKSVRQRSVGPEEPGHCLLSRGRSARLLTASTVDQTPCNDVHRRGLGSMYAGASL